MAKNQFVYILIKCRPGGSFQEGLNPIGKGKTIKLQTRKEKDANGSLMGKVPNNGLKNSRQRGGSSD